MNVAPAVPAVARLWIVEVPILAWLSRWNAIEKPSIRFSNSGSIASGVTSRPVKPVPPVVITTSTPGSAIHLLIMPRIASTSSTMISRAASLWPAATIRSDSVVPDLSSASERVSEIVNTAMLSGMNCFDPSMEDIMLYLVSRTRCSVLHAAPQRRDPFFVTLHKQLGPGSAAHRKSAAPHPGHARPLQRCRAECIACLQRSLLIAGHEPSLALFGRAVREGIRHHPPGRLPLQRIVADCGRGSQGAVDIA